MARPQPSTGFEGDRSGGGRRAGYHPGVPTIEELLSPAYVDGLETLPLNEVRARRDECQEVADVLSYLRRIIQGRLDLVHADFDRRAQGRAPDLGQLVEELKRGRILADRGRSGGLGRLPKAMEPAREDGWITRELDEILDSGRASSLPEIPEDELHTIAVKLIELERKVSDRRAALHDRTNELQAEIVRRYKSGAASVDSLLK
jgi:hypothetical protein